MKKVMVTKYIKNAGILLYFLLLGIERLLAIIFGFMPNSKYCFFSQGSFSGYIHALTLLSLLGAFVLLNKQFIYMIKGLFSVKNESYDKLDYGKIAICSGVLLLGGMVHTNFTLLIVQFIAYGGMIASMLMVVIDEWKNRNNRLKLLINFIYIVCFAMAIPVAYKINKDHVAFLETYQCIASFVLVVIYTYSMYIFYSNHGENKFMVSSFILLIVFDLPIFILRLNETLNIFLLAFPILCFILIILDAYHFINKNYYVKVNKE